MRPVTMQPSTIHAATGLASLEPTTSEGVTDASSAIGIQDLPHPEPDFEPTAEGGGPLPYVPMRTTMRTATRST